MSYQVLARKWRPQTFQQLVGQEHVVRALVNALDQQRLHHAFLFTGTRGVGKTTIARIFAKALNCEQGVSSTPCGQCSTCKEIEAGRFVDLLEVDAASRTKVDETRELLENVPYAPSRGRFKVYLIDEVHMFSNHSFNALLKTLEEPPPHVKFLLATTDPQKLPVTILSRCLQFSLQRLPSAMISAYLQQVLEQENLPSEGAALHLIARAAEGSMRDALSLLDQAIAFGGGRVETAAVSTMLGSIDRRQVVELLTALAANDAQQVLQCVAALDAMAVDYQAVLAELLSLLQRVALVQAVPAALHSPHDDPVADAADVQRLAASITAEDVQLFYQIALLGRRDLPLNPQQRGAFEMVLLRMLCFRPATLEAASAPVPNNSASKAPSSTLPKSSPTAPATASYAVTAAAPGAATSLTTAWANLIQQLDLNARDVNLVRHCELLKQQDDLLELRIEPSLEPMFNAPAKQRLQQALEKHFGRSIQVSFQVGAVQDTPAAQYEQQRKQQHKDAQEQAQHDPQVQALCATFDAQIAAVHPHDSSTQ